MKLFIVTLLVLFKSCDATDPDSTSFTIATNSKSYTIQEKISVPVIFTNALGKEAAIINTGCGFPNFSIERNIDNVWQTEGGPVCVALAVAPAIVSDGGKYEATVEMYAEKNIVTGTYRMKFDIREKDLGASIDNRFLYSNTFTIYR